MIDLADFKQWEEVEQALHGNLQPLLALLRSDVLLSKLTRDYIAEQIEREPDKRFRRQRYKDMDVKKNDRLLLYRVFMTKMEIALRKFGAEADVDVVYEAFDAISDRHALDFLCENYGLELNQHDLDNALRRSPPGIFDPRGPRRQLKKSKP